MPRTATTSSCTRTDHGFTLLELLVVLAVLALLSAILAPNSSSLDPQRLDAATAELRTALRYARDEARRSNSPVLVDLETQPGVVRLLEGPCSKGSVLLTDPRPQQAFVVDLARQARAPGLSVTANFAAADGKTYAGIVFDTDGSALELCSVASKKGKGTPASAVVTLSLDKDLRQIQISPATGRVSGG